MTEFNKTFYGIMAPNEHKRLAIAHSVEDAAMINPIKPKRKVRRIYSSRDYVVLEMDDDSKVYKSRREVLDWLRATSDAIKHNDQATPRDELEKELFLLESGVKACAEAARYSGIEVKSKNVDIFLRMCDEEGKRAKRRKAPLGAI